MKAFVTEKYGKPDVLQLRDVDKPTIIEDDQVVVRVQAVSVNAYDWHLLTADIPLVRLMGEGFLKPKNTTPGADIAGLVEQVGPKVTMFQPGDAVFGDIGGRGFAEFARTREKYLAPKPANLSFEQAAAVPMAALTALQALRDHGQIQPGEKVVIQGASGGVGTFAIQLAKHFGAQVTAVTSTRNLDQARSLGADHVIDYTKEDFTRNGQQYDLIIAANGYHPLSAYKRALAPRGRYVMAGGNMRQLFQAMLLGSWMTRNTGQKMGGFTAQLSQEDLLVIKDLLEAGKIVPVIDRIYPFSQAPDALAYLGTGHARGKVVVTVAPDAG